MREIHLHGPPGCGKTTALASRWVPDAVDRFGPTAVVICSLTKTAAQEIAGRGLPIPPRNVGTLHAFAFRGLQQPTLVAERIADWNVAHPAFSLSGAAKSVDNPEMEAMSGATHGDKMQGKMEILRNQLQPRDSWPVDVLQFADKWTAWKEEEELMDFTDLIEQSIEHLPLCPGAPAVMILDEAQDSSALELKLFREWGKHASFIVLCGDGDQAIYEWRGASAEAFYGSEIPDDDNFHLTQSYRVPRAVHSAAQEWISDASHRYAVDYKPRDFEGEVVRSAGSSRNVSMLVDDMVKDLDQGKTIMLLAACSFSLRGALRELRGRGEAFHNPYRMTNGAWNPMRGGALRLAEYLRPAMNPDDELWSWYELGRWIELVAAKHLKPKGKAAIKLRASEASTAPESVTFEELSDMLGEEFLTEAIAATEKGPSEAVEFLRSKMLASKFDLLDFGFRVAAARGPHVLSDLPYLTVGTIHSVKGGEADVVYLLPDVSPSAMREWITAGKARDAVLRLMYVGMTRAREKLVLCSPSSSSSIPWPSGLC